MTAVSHEPISTELMVNHTDEPTIAAGPWGAIGREIIDKTLFVAPIAAGVASVHTLDPGTATETEAAIAGFALSCAAVAIRKLRRRQAP